MSDIGPGDELIAIKSHPHGDIVIGQKYICEKIITPENCGGQEFHPCFLCGDDEQVAIQLVGDPDSGWCHCVFRKIGGEDIFKKFMEDVLKPIEVHDTVAPKIPEKV